MQQTDSIEKYPSNLRVHTKVAISVSPVCISTKSFGGCMLKAFMQGQ